MAKAKQESTALAAAPSTAVAVSEEAAALADLGDFFGGFESASDGLGEYDASDQKVPLKVWNMKGPRMRNGQPTGEMHQVNEFYDTQTEKTQKRLRVVFLYSKKLREFAYYDNATKETVRVCGSHDRVVGTLKKQHPTLKIADGTQRNCEGCPDQQWRETTDTDGKKKRVQNCYDVHAVIALEIGEQNEIGAPCMIRFKKTSLQPFMTHLRKHHLGKLRVGREQRNMPICAYLVDVTLSADQSGNFATPVFGDPVSIRKVFDVETCEAIRDQMAYFENATHETRAALEQSERVETKHASSIDTEGATTETYRQDDFADG